MGAEIREIFSGKPIDPETNEVDEIIGTIVDARFDPDNSFHKAGRCFLIYEYQDENGCIQYGEFNSGMLASAMLWMMEKVKLGMLEN